VARQTVYEWLARYANGMIDDHSRFIVYAKVVAWATARPVRQALVRRGIREHILTDVSAESAVSGAQIPDPTAQATSTAAATSTTRT
jgi:hypothetical protein